jgi:outer membrane protein TolC
MKRPVHEKDRRFNSNLTPFKQVARGLAYALFAAMIAGCSVGPRYAKPSTRLQPFHNAPAIDSLPATTPASLEAWWTGFHDPELTRIVERVFHENLDLSASLARVQQARAAAKEAGAQLKPSASLVGQDDWFRQSLDSPAVRYAGQVPNFSRNQSSTPWHTNRRRSGSGGRLHAGAWSPAPIKVRQ